MVYFSLHSIYELLENVKKTNLLIQNIRISTTQESNRISKRTPVTPVHGNENLQVKMNGLNGKL